MYAWENFERVLLVFGAVGTMVALIKLLLDARSAALKAAIQASSQTELLLRINKELHPNGGASLADRVSRIEQSLTDHRQQATDYFEANAADHETLHRRIDGLYEQATRNALAAARRTSDRHHSAREDDQDVQ
jgi:type IV secretory pathway TraG/TraD family ATPase VirD4